MPGDRLYAHVAAQATDHTAKAVGEAAALVDELTSLHASLILADKHLCQLNVDDARRAQ